MKKPDKKKNLLSRILAHKALLFFLGILILSTFFRTYQLEARNEFRWDQVDNAWAAKNIIVDHKYPLVGMVVKQNTGFNIGPAYYYLIAPFYFFSGLDPIASCIFAVVSATITILVLYFVTKKVFSEKVALLASLIYACSLYIIEDDRVQWPVNFIPWVGLLIFYCLYKICTGNPKYVLPLALLLGFSFHIHFTSVFYPIIILLTLPFFPRTREMFKYCLYSIPLLVVWFIPHLLLQSNAKGMQAKNLTGYLESNYHGLHLRRILQIANDAFIEIGELLYYKPIKFLRFFVFPLFCFSYLFKHTTRDRLILCYLFALWFLVPWIVFSVYKGEITDYYFNTTRLFAVIIISYLVVRLFQFKNPLPRLAGLSLVAVYLFFNAFAFFHANYEGLAVQRIKTEEKIKRGEKIEFVQGSPQSYLYYLYEYKKGEK